MPPPPQAMGDEPSIFQKLKMGATMGGLVGVTIGAIFGTVAILRSGAGPRGFLPSLSGYMLTSGATFAFFMSIGTVIRTDGLTLTEWARVEEAKMKQTLLCHATAATSASLPLSSSFSATTTSSSSSPSPSSSSSSSFALVREWEKRRNNQSL